MKKTELEAVVLKQEEEISFLLKTILVMKGQSKFSDIKHDIFIFSVVLNIVFTVFTTINAFGGIL